MAGAVERLLRAADRFQQAHTFLALPVAVVKKFGDDQAGKHAALLAYYGFLSLFPLLLVFATLLAYALSNNPRLQEQLIDAAVAQFPVLGTQIEGSIKAIESSGLGLVVGVLGTLWGGLGIAQSAQDAMNALCSGPSLAGPGPASGGGWHAGWASWCCWPVGWSWPPRWPSSPRSDQAPAPRSLSPAPCC